MPRAFADLSEGQELPREERRVTPAQAAIAWGGDFSKAPRQFWDADFARDLGLPGTIVPGPVKFVLLEQYLRRWLDGAGRLRKLQLSHRRPNLMAEPMVLGGHVVRLYEEDGARLADLELFVDTPEGERAVRASATVAFRLD